MQFGFDRRRDHVEFVANEMSRGQVSSANSHSTNSPTFINHQRHRASPLTALLNSKSEKKPLSQYILWAKCRVTTVISRTDSTYSHNALNVGTIHTHVLC